MVSKQIDSNLNKNYLNSLKSSYYTTNYNIYKYLIYYNSNNYYIVIRSRLNKLYYIFNMFNSFGLSNYQVNNQYNHFKKDLNNPNIENDNLSMNLWFDLNNNPISKSRNYSYLNPNMLNKFDRMTSTRFSFNNNLSHMLYSLSLMVHYMLHRY